MSVTFKFDGTYRNSIKNVKPEDIVLRGKILTVKGIAIPFTPNSLFNAFYTMEKEARHKLGTVYINLLKSGDIQYASDTSDYAPDYYVGRILGFGNNSPSFYTVRHVSTRIPDDNEYLVGRSEKW